METGEPLNAEVIINATSVGTTPVTLPLAFSRSDKAEAWPEFQVDFQIPTSYQTESIALRRNYFDFRTVVHCGEIQMGGASVSGEDNLFGEHVNFLFRMEKVASSLKKLTLFSEEAVEMLGIGDRTASLGDHAVHSFTGSYSFFEIILG